MNSGHLIVPCPSCGVKNRIPQSKINLGPKCGKCGSPIPIAGGSVIPVTDADFQQKILSSPLPVLLDCWAPWCGPCRMIGPVMEEMAREYAGRALIAKLNVDENPMTAQRLGIQSIPTLLLFKNGQVVDRVVGAAPKEQIAAHLNRILA